MPATGGGSPTDTGPPPSTFPLRRPNFLRLWVGSVASSAGTAIGTLVITWIVYSVTGSALAISVLGIVQFLPTLAFGLVAGALIDRWDRRRLMVACDVARCICVGALALYVALVGAGPVVLIGVVFLVAIFSTIFRPATNAILPRILAPSEVVDGNGILQSGTTVAQFVGSPLGGLLLITAGAALGLAVNSVTFAVSGAMIFLIALPAREPTAVAASPAKRSLLAEVREGLGYIRSQPALLLITVSAMGANFFLTMWGGFTVVYVAEQLREGATGFAALLAAGTAGFAVGAILPGRLRAASAPGMWIIAGWGSTGFFIVGLAVTHLLLPAAILSFAVGLGLSLGNTTWLSGVQRIVPDQYLGRYFATDEAGSFAMIPAGLAVGGLLVLALGIGWTYVIAGVGSSLMNVPLLLSPGVRNWGRGPATPASPGPAGG